ESPIGRVIDVWGQKRTIIGVTKDILDRPSDLDGHAAFYVPASQQASPQMKVAIGTSGDPMSMLPAIERMMHEVDPELPLAEARTMQTIADGALSEQHLALWVFGVFAVMAQGLAAVGVYALLAYIAQQRRKEVAIRTALGASRGDILWLVLRDGARLAAGGVI